MVVIFILYNNYAHSNKEDKVWFRRISIVCSSICTNMQVVDLVKGEQTNGKSKVGSNNRSYEG